MDIDEESIKLSRRTALGLAAGAAAAPMLATPANAAVAAAPLPEGALLAMRVAGNEVDRMQGIIGLVLRKAADGEAPNAWAAFTEDRWGGVVYDNADIARFAAVGNWTCYRDITQEANRHKQNLAAKHVLLADYSEDMIMLSDDRVVSTDEIMDYARDDEIVWRYGAREEPFDFDIEEALDAHLADSFEDAESHVIDREGLRKFWREWTAKQSLSGYFEDHSLIVILDAAAFPAEVAEWTARLALCEAAIARIKAEGPPATHLLYVTDTVHRIARAIGRSSRQRRSWAGADVKDDGVKT